VSADVETLTVHNIGTQLSGAKSDEALVFDNSKVLKGRPRTAMCAKADTGILSKPERNSDRDREEVLRLVRAVGCGRTSGALPHPYGS
jgi:hypothetical protein